VQVCIIDGLVFLHGETLYQPGRIKRSEYFSHVIRRDGVNRSTVRCILKGGRWKGRETIVLVLPLRPPGHWFTVSIESPFVCIIVPDDYAEAVPDDNADAISWHTTQNLVSCQLTLLAYQTTSTPRQYCICPTAGITLYTAVTCPR
jgi:hypothetical protein